jgi:hypothetical protein
MCRATQQRAPTTAPDKRLLLPVIWLVAKRQQARTADSEREWRTQQVSAFRRGGAGAVVRQMRTRKVGLAARRQAVTARVAAH